jgi:hypothetical protein
MITQLAVRVTEDPSRPMGHAVITVEGVIRTLETFEFALRRHGFADNNLGPNGWQGPECWLTPEEAWYSGDSLKFVVGADVVYQMESMPYELVLRGQGMEGSAKVTFVWPVELELEESAGGERQAVGGTKVHPVPRARSSKPIATTATTPEVPLPELQAADISIPNLAIPSAGPSQPLNVKPSGEIQPAEPPPLTAQTTAESLPLPPVPAEPPPLPPQRAVEPPPAPPQAEPIRTERPPSELPLDSAGPPAARPGIAGWIIGVITLIGFLAAGIGIWLFLHRGGTEPPSPLVPTVTTPAAKPDSPFTPSLPTLPTPRVEQSSPPQPGSNATPGSASLTEPSSGALPAPRSQPTVEFKPGPPSTSVSPPVPLPALPPRPTAVPETTTVPKTRPLPESVASPPAVPGSAAVPVTEPARQGGSAGKRDLESELQSQFKSAIEVELEETLKRKSVSSSVPERN